MQTIWISPTEYVTSDPSVKISYKGPMAIVKSQRIGLKWVLVGLRLPPNVRIEKITICYQIISQNQNQLLNNFITKVQLIETGAPDQVEIIHEVNTDLVSTSPVCFPIDAGGIVPKPGRALSLALQLHYQQTIGKVMLGAVGVEYTPIDLCANRRLLSDFGPYATIAEAEQTFQKAISTLMDEDGGVLCIPRDAPDGFYPRHTEQQSRDNKPAVTVFDCRLGFERAYVPSIGIRNSEGGGCGSRLIERDLAENVGWQGVHSTEYIQSRYRGGASSYLQPLQEAIIAGLNRKINVRSHRGLFVGQTLNIAGVEGFGGPSELVTVKELGLDDNGPYFVADLLLNHPEKAYAYNKNEVNGLTIEDTSNCDNQSESLIVHRKTYGNGDTFGISALLTYQGDIMSAGGDEGGIGISSQILHDLDCFWGEVESWNPQTRELIYKPGMSAPQKLGTSRPLVNMNQQKWIQSGKVRVTWPGNDSKIIGIPGVDWDQSIVGRFIAINDPSEYYTGSEIPGIHDIHRWWHITDVKDAENGFKHLFTERTWWDKIIKTQGPTLFLDSNYTAGNHIVDLDYIIAPGAWVSDVRHAVAGNTQGHTGQTTQKDERTLILAPSPSIGTDFDFEAGDLITNAPGADPWLPTGFRARQKNYFPGSMKGASFLGQNLGKVQIEAGLVVSGPGGNSTLEESKANQKDGLVPFDYGVYILAATRTGILFRGPVQDVAIDFWQTHGNEKKIRWFHQGGGAGHSTLHVLPGNGNFIFTGGDIDYQTKGAINLRGLSGSGNAAKNLRGFNVLIGAGEMDATITFPTPEEDANYAIMIECNWLTNKAVKEKTKTGFTVVFDQAAPAGRGMLDWLLVR